MATKKPSVIKKIVDDLIANDPEIKKRRYDEAIAKLVEEIKTQCDSMEDGWLELTLEPEEDHPEQEIITMKVARIPFERWMRNARQHRASEWTNIAPSGLKMQMDNRNHSDWWLSSGIPLKYSYYTKYSRGSEHKSGSQIYRESLDPSDPDYLAPDPDEGKFISLAIRLNTASWDYRFESTTNRGRNTRFLVSGEKGKEYNGSVMHIRTDEDVAKFVEEAISGKRPTLMTKFNMIAVIPDCSVKYDQIIKHAAVIITEVGSAAAHVVKVAREDGVPVIWCPDAFKEFFNGEDICVKDNYVFGRS